jgi:hypothetical protein
MQTVIEKAKKDWIASSRRANPRGAPRNDGLRESSVGFAALRAANPPY